MRLHVVGLPFPYSPACAYGGKVSRFVTMMRARGHDVIEHTADHLDDTRTFDPDGVAFRRHNAKAITEIARDDDGIICLIAGRCQQAIAEALPHLKAVEFGIGYGGVFSRYRVFESYAWMHTVLGAMAGDAHAADGSEFDAVIPNYYDPAEFPEGRGDGGYFLFMGRLIERKGAQLAADVCERLGAELILAGEGTPPTYGTDLGLVDHAKRAELMGGATALFAPTRYIEPFGGVVAEAMLCGTPVITSDWGAFTETVDDGITGFRCRGEEEYVEAAGFAAGLDRERVRRWALARFSLDAVAPQYEDYFERIGVPR